MSATALRQLVHELRGELRACGAKGVTERDGAAIHVHLLLRHLELAHDGNNLRRKRFIELDEIDVGNCHACTGKCFWHCLDGTNAHDVRINTGHGKRDKARQRCEPQCVRVRATHEHHRGRAVREWAGVARGHGAGWLERRAQFGESFRRGFTTNEFVRCKAQRLHLLLRALPRYAFHRNGNNLSVERARCDGRARPLLTAQRPRILIRSAHLPAVRHTFRREAHADVRLHGLGVQPSVIARHWHLAHHLDAAREHHVGHAAHDLHGAAGDGLQAG